MIHEIAPEHMDNQYHEKNVQPDSQVCFCTGRKLLVRIQDGQISWPLYKEVKELAGECTYLFSISDRDYFLAEPTEEVTVPDAVWVEWREIRDKQPTGRSICLYDSDASEPVAQLCTVLRKMRSKDRT